MQLNDPSLLRSAAFVDGQWIAARSGDTYPVHNPATGDPIATVARCAADDTVQAIEAAHAALPGWRTRSARQRSALLGKWRDLILAARDDLASLLTAEQGKPLSEARGEIAYGASFMEWFAEEAKRVYGDTIPAPGQDRRLIVIKQPVGVVACITPWNFPNAMLARKMAAALAAGCTVVCKPAEETPLSALALAVLAERAGIPPGVINIVSGDKQAIGAQLTSHPAVRKLSFTGSTAVGKLLLEQCASTVKRTSMELGGNAPFIVFDDADLDAAVKGALSAKYRNSGQTCICANRFIVHDSIHDDFVARLTAATGKLKVGNGVDNGVSVGPLIHAQAAGKVRDLIDDATARGAHAVTGQRTDNLGECYVAPTVLTDVTDTMRVFNEEIFGPVAPVMRFRTEAEAIALANATPYGLAGYFYARDIGRVWRVAEALEYGMVAVNEGALSNPAAPFGGIKESGHGREGSRYGLDDYLELKYLCMGGI